MYFELKITWYGVAHAQYRCIAFLNITIAKLILQTEFINDEDSLNI